MLLNQFAETTEPLDLRDSDEFRSLAHSAADLGIPHAPDVRYLSRNTVLRHQRFHFLEWGDPAAPPLLLLHGGNQSAHAWDLVSLHLARRYHIYALDQRGHGDSEWARDSDYSTRTLAEDALAFIAQEGLEPPIVCGHSMGGMAAMAATVKRPDLPRALVIVDIGPEPSGSGTSAIRDFITKNVEFDTIEQFVDRVAGYDRFRTREHMERSARYNLIQRADGKYISKSDRTLHDPTFGGRDVRAIGRPSLDEVRTFSCPTLVVRGERSSVLEPDAAQRFVDALPQGRLVTVANCGHNVHSQNTTGFLDAVRPFLESLERPAG